MASVMVAELQLTILLINLDFTHRHRFGVETMQIKTIQIWKHLTLFPIETPVFHHFSERIIKQVRLLNMDDQVDLLVSSVKKEKKNLHEPT